MTRPSTVHMIFHMFLFDFFRRISLLSARVRATDLMAKSAVGLIGGVDFPIGLIFRLLRSNFSFSEMDCYATPLTTQ